MLRARSRGASACVGPIGALPPGPQSRIFYTMNEFLDLFGDIVPPHRGRRGRPAHVPTRENRTKVACLLIAGCPVPAIARAMKITPPTLRKHYLRLNSEKN